MFLLQLGVMVEQSTIRNDQVKLRTGKQRMNSYVLAQKKDQAEAKTRPRQFCFEDNLGLKRREQMIHTSSLLLTCIKEPFSLLKKLDVFKQRCLAF